MCDIKDKEIDQLQHAVTQTYKDMQKQQEQL